jgi:hypothetical protein
VKVTQWLEQLSDQELALTATLMTDELRRRFPEVEELLQYVRNADDPTKDRLNALADHFIETAFDKHTVN